MSDDGAYFSHGLMKGLNRELGPAVQREMKIVTDQWKAHSEGLEKINQQNLYYLGSALGASSEERMSRYALIAYIGSIFSVLNKKLGKDVVRQMLSLDTPDMERVLRERLAEMEGVVSSEGAIDGFVKVGTKGILKNPHVMRGYQETIGVYENVYGATISPKASQDIGHDFNKLNSKPMLEFVQEKRMSS